MSGMDEVQRRVLRENRLSLINDMDVDRLLHHTLQDDIITGYHYDEVKSNGTRGGRAGTFLNILERRGPRAFSSLCKALDHTNPHLAVLLRNRETLLRNPNHAAGADNATLESRQPEEHMSSRAYAPLVSHEAPAQNAAASVRTQATAPPMEPTQQNVQSHPQATYGHNWPPQRQANYGQWQQQPQYNCGHGANWHPQLQPIYSANWHTQPPPFYAQYWPPPQPTYGQTWQPQLQPTCGHNWQQQFDFLPACTQPNRVQRYSYNMKDCGDITTVISIDF